MKAQVVGTRGSTGLSISSSNNLELGGAQVLWHQPQLIHFIRENALIADNNHSVSKHGAELNAPLGRRFMSTSAKRGALLKGSIAPMLFVAISLASTGANAACTGPGAPSDTQTKCLTAVQIP